MDGQRDIFGKRAHLDSKHAFGDHLSRAHAHDADA